MRTRLYVAAVLGGIAALVLVVVLVFQFGRYDPDPPSLSANPHDGIPGEVLYLRDDFCFVRASASGAESHKLACMPQYFGGPRLYWVDRNTAGLLIYDQRGAILWHVDLSTGAMTDTGRVISQPEKPLATGPFGGATAPDGTAAFVDEKGDLFLLIDGARTKVASFDTADYNQPQVLLWSPDSRWMLLQYFPRHGGGQHLWIVSRDGATEGTLTTDAAAGLAAWRIGDAVQPALP